MHCGICASGVFIYLLFKWQYNIKIQYYRTIYFYQKKREKEEKLFSEVAREEEKFHKFLHSFTVHF